MRMEMSWIVCCVLQGYQTVQTMFDDREMLDRCVRALCHHHYYGIRGNLLQEWSSSLQQCSNNWRISNKEQWSCYVQWWLTTTIKHFILIFPFLAPLLGLITIPRLTGSNRCFYKIIIIILISLSGTVAIRIMVWRKKKNAEDVFSRVDHYRFAILAHLIGFYYLFLYFFTVKLLQSKQTGPGDRKGKKNKRQVGEEANTKKKNREKRH